MEEVRARQAAAGSGVVGRLVIIDALRAVAALLVVLNHSDLGARSPGAVRWLVPVGRLGYTGVGLFLVISGFSIHLRWAATRDASFSGVAFWRRRLVRLYPTYYAALATIGLTLTIVSGPGQIAAERAAREHLPLWFAAANHLVVIGGNFTVVALLPQAWSLALEEQIYALYSVAARFVRDLRPMRLLMASLVLSLVWRLGVSVLTPAATARNLMYFQVPSRLFEWVLGLVAVEAYVGNVRLPEMAKRLEVGVGLLLVSGYLGLQPAGFLLLNSHRFAVSGVLLDPLFGIAFFVCLNSLVSGEQRLLASPARPILHLLGTVGLSSYSMYLLHPLILRVAALIVPPHGLVGRGAAWLAVIFGSYGFYLVVERRFIARARRPRQSCEVASHEATSHHDELMPVRA